ncbi:unnamed protein product [Cylindrotheca closterium]|uniref:Uncharacterized protein n=1 Tax=Cylindrotheca closterium TaxID=2856 RepID=A0AAD2FQR7_9STRA|nr:unnamed protein product [Cylindrotheca closterium]
MYRSTQLARSATRHIRKVPTPRRPYSSALDPVGLTPKEDLMLDATAWFVALALVYSPKRNFDGADFQNTGRLQDKADSRREVYYEIRHWKMDTTPKVMMAQINNQGK